MREVLGRTRGAREVQYRVDGTVDRDAGDDVVLHEREACVIGEVRDVLAVTGEEVVDRDDLPLASAEEVAEVRTKEPGAPGDDGPGHQRPTPW